MKLNKERCIEALEFYHTKISGYEKSITSYTILKNLIDEYFNDKSLKFEDLEFEMPIWDSKDKEWCILKNATSSLFFGKQYISLICFSNTNDIVDLEWEDDRFYRKKKE